MSKLTYSIITVCFNSEKTIKRTIESVLNQTIDDYEYLIIDGGSKDATLDIINSYSEKFNGKLKVISEQDNGIYDAMNKGISLAKGNLIGMVNSDDFYEPNTLEIVNEAYDQNIDYQVIYGFQRCLNMGKEERIVFYNHSFLDKQMITHPTCFVSRNVYEKFGVFDLKYKSSADYDFMLRLFHTGAVHFVPVYSILSNFELNGMSSSEICVRETAKIHLDYGTISSFKYIEILFRSYVHNILKIFRIHK